MDRSQQWRCNCRSNKLKILSSACVSCYRCICDHVYALVPNNESWSKSVQNHSPSHVEICIWCTDIFLLVNPKRAASYEIWERVGSRGSLFTWWNRFCYVLLSTSLLQLISPSVGLFLFCHISLLNLWILMFSVFSNHKWRSKSLDGSSSSSRWSFLRQNNEAISSSSSWSKTSGEQN